MAVKQFVYDRKTMNLISETIVDSDFKPDKKKFMNILATHILQNKGAELYEYISTKSNVGETDR